MFLGRVGFTEGVKVGIFRQEENGTLKNTSVIRVLSMT